MITRLVWPSIRPRALQSSGLPEPLPAFVWPVSAVTAGRTCPQQGVASRAVTAGSTTDLAIITGAGLIMVGTVGSRATIAVLPVLSANKVAGVRTARGHGAAGREVNAAPPGGRAVSAALSGAPPTATRGEAGVTTELRQRPHADRRATRNPAAIGPSKRPAPIPQVRAGTASKAGEVLAVLAVVVDLVSGDDLAAAATGAGRANTTRHRNLPGGQVAISAGRQGALRERVAAHRPVRVSPPTSRNGWIA